MNVNDITVDEYVKIVSFDKSRLEANDLNESFVGRVGRVLEIIKDIRGHDYVKLDIEQIYNGYTRDFSYWTTKEIALESDGLPSESEFLDFIREC
ncbi:MAG: hypothetical protein MJZ03_00570 [archaeon]|nr:hypothetical protein [archaeon]